MINNPLLFGSIQNLRAFLSRKFRPITRQNWFEPNPNEETPVGLSWITCWIIFGYSRAKAFNKRSDAHFTLNSDLSFHGFLNWQFPDRSVQNIWLQSGIDGPKPVDPGLGPRQNESLDPRPELTVLPKVLFFGPEKCLKEFKSRVSVAPKSDFGPLYFPF